MQQNRASAPMEDPAPAPIDNGQHDDVATETTSAKNPRPSLEPIWRQVFSGLDRKAPGLNRQIRRLIVHAIETGMLRANTRLPSSRILATHLGIGRNTVTAAYQRLIDEGLLIARERSGIFVAAVDIAQPESRDGPEAEADWSSRFAVHPSKLSMFYKPRDWQAYPYPFLFGQYDRGLFPINNWREAVRATSSVQEIQGWAADMIDDDDPDLLEQLRLQVLPRRGIRAAEGEIIVTIGSQHALSLIVQLLVDRDTPAAVENPGYPDVRNMIELATGHPVLLNSDAHGVIPDETFAGNRVAFITVSHQCPTTRVMPLERRRALIEAAARHDVVLVEDDYDADLSVEGDAAIPPLKSLDSEGRVIYVGSFSKVLAPGLRVGYVVAPRPVIRELRMLRRVIMRHPPINNQRTLATFIALGHYRQHLNRIGNEMLARARLIARILPVAMPSFTFSRGEGAANFWIEGPEGFDCRAAAARAQDHGILIEPGHVFFADARDGRRFFRLGFGAIPTQRIEAGLTKLGALLEDDIRTEPVRHFDGASSS